MRYYLQTENEIVSFTGKWRSGDYHVERDKLSSEDKYSMFSFSYAK
jgi:hypothetical protein